MSRRHVAVVAAFVAACAGGLLMLGHPDPGGAAARANPKLTVVIQAGKGTVTSAPAGIACPPTCSNAFAPGSVTLTAGGTEGHRFDAWKTPFGTTCTIQPAQPNVCRLSISSDLTVGVVFRPAATLRVVPNGRGTVTVSPAGLDLQTGTPTSSCDSAVRDQGCPLAYLPGTAVTATAAQGSGRTFAGWSAAGCQSAQCTVQAVEGETALVANFNPLQLVVVVAGTGVVTSAPVGIDCGNNRFDCAVDAPLGTKYVLNAGTGIHEWRFGCEPEGGDVHAARCTATVAALPTEVGVAFNGAGGPEPPNRISIRLDVGKQDAGTSTVRGGKIDCGATCTATYKFGDMEQLTPMGSGGVVFQQWIGGCGKTRVCSFPVGPVTSLTAVFGPALKASIVRLRTAGRGSGRKVIARVKVNQAATVLLQLRRNGRRVAKTQASIRSGETPVTVKVPRGASSGSFGVVAVVTAGNQQKTLSRSIRVGR